MSAATVLGASSQAPANDIPTSLDRIREELAQTPPSRLKLDRPVEAPVARFKTQVDGRVYLLTLDEQMRKEFELTGLKRQSAEWAAKCCGISLDPLFEAIKDARERRKVRKIREQIAREIAELEALARDARPAGDATRKDR
jgi:hypothetical protein